MGEQHVIGRHLVVADGDVVSVYWDGPANLEEVSAIQRIYEQRLIVHPRLFSVFQVARAHPPSLEVRKHMAKWRRTHRVAGSAIVGASLPIRAIATLYLRATSLLGLKTWPVRFVDSEAEAQAFFDELRGPSRSAAEP